MVPSIAKDASAATAKDATSKESADSVRRKSGESLQKQRTLSEGIRFLRESASLCDVYLVVGDEAFPAHQAMLSAMSPAFGSYLQEESVAGDAGPLSRVRLEVKQEFKEEVKHEIKEEDVKREIKLEAKDEDSKVTYEAIAMEALTGGEGTADGKPPAPEASGAEATVPDTSPEQQAAAPEKHFKLRVNGATHAESVKIMLDYIYQVGTGCAWEYSPSSLEVNKEVIRLARQFELKHLHEHAARWLTRGLTTKNLVERLVICEEFKLGMLREKLIEQLTANPAELAVVCRSTEVLAHPTILQDLLVQVSSLCGMAPQRSSPPKREREADEVAEEKPVEKSAEDDKATDKEKPEKPSTKVSEKVSEKNPEEEKQEKVKTDKDKVEKNPAKTSTKVPALKKKRTT